MHRIGFDSDQYIEMQSRHIAQRRSEFGGKLYLEFGGKLIDDMHASRVLPGFTPDNKVRMLRELADEVEIIVAVNAKDFARRKVRADMGTTYDDEVLRQIDEFRERGLYVGSVVITQWTDDNKAAAEVKERFEKLGIRVYRHFPIPGYPSDVERIVSDEGYGANEYVETSRNLVVVTLRARAPVRWRPACLAVPRPQARDQVRRYAKWETFDLEHSAGSPVNIACGSPATADLDDVNMIDPFHLEAYGIKTVNYNRDVEIFPVLNRLFEKILGSSPYKSPTDAENNASGPLSRRRRRATGGLAPGDHSPLLQGPRDREEGDERARAVGAHLPANEPRRRGPHGPPGRASCPRRNRGPGSKPPRSSCPTARSSRARRRRCWAAPRRCCSTPSRSSPACRTRSSSWLLSPSSRSSASRPATWARATRLHTDEVLIALAVSANGDDNARRALDKLSSLRGARRCGRHPGPVDEGIFRSLGIQVATEPVYATKSLPPVISSNEAGVSIAYQRGGAGLVVSHCFVFGATGRVAGEGGAVYPWRR